ncbi:MAG TPA: HD domain-containing protein, partial [Tepidisphaeraceae bacterium]|nr:HD domain-containing protein [Tepidisphaeraceae bacterium]
MNILDTPRETAYDDIVRLVQEILQVPIALVSLVHRERQWFKACIGLDTNETSREVSFCAHAIARPDLSEPFIITDATLDARFAKNPLVLGSPNIRMYVGQAVLAPDGQPLGALCAIDDKPRSPTPSQIRAIKTLARSVSGLFALRQSAEDLRESEERNRLILDTARDGVVTVDSSGRIVSWNAGAQRLVGRTPADARGRPCATTVFDAGSPYANNDAFLAKLKSSCGAGYIGSEDSIIRRADGAPLPVEISTACLQTRDGLFYSVFLRDLSDRVQRQELERDTAMREVTMFALAKLAESRDPETGAHIERVQSYCKVLAEQLAAEGPYQNQVDAEFIRLIYSTSPLHDIGKVGIPDDILLKPGRLSDREFEIMKTHAQIGADTLRAAMKRFPDTRFLKLASNIAATHHERWDGSGYPEGLAGDAIPLCGRIVALADVYDALTSRRVYKAAFTDDLARGIIVKESGKHFDPVIVEAYLKSEERFR